MDSCYKKLYCSECGFFFEYKNLLKIYMNLYYSFLDVLQCYYCGKLFEKCVEFVSYVIFYEILLKDFKEM